MLVPDIEGHGVITGRANMLSQPEIGILPRLALLLMCNRIGSEILGPEEGSMVIV